MYNQYLKRDKAMDIYSDFLISHSGYATATSISKLFDEKISHDQITYLLSSKKFSSYELFKSIKKFIREVENEEGVLSIDDTISEKPYTDENCIVNYHYSHSKGTTVKGINILSGILTSSLSNEDVNIPVSYKIVNKDIEYINKDNKTKYRSSKSKIDLFKDIVLDTINYQIKYKYVLADSWFFCKEIAYFLNKHNKQYILGIKSNRNVALSIEDYKSNKYIRLDSIFNESNERVIYVKDINIPLKAFKISFLNEECLYLITNDLSLSLDTIYHIYSRRWNIEEYHKSIKQNAALSKSPTKRVISQSNHIFGSILAFCKLEKLKIKSKLNHFALRSRLLLKANRVMYDLLQKYIGENRLISIGR